MRPLRRTVAVLETGRDQEFSGFGGLGGVHGRPRCVIQFDGDHHAGQQDGIGQEQKPASGYRSFFLQG